MAQATQTTTTAATAIADPAPLGLLGFATTTLVLSVANTGIYSEKDLAGTAALGLALFFGGLAQFLAGMWEFKRGNTFGATAFTGYGAFWLSFWVLNTVGANAPGGTFGIAWYLVGWAVFTFVVFVATFRLNYGLVVVLGLLFLTYLLLAIGAFDAVGTSTTWHIGGWLGILTAIAAYYMAAAGLLKSVGADLLPVGPIQK